MAAEPNDYGENDHRRPDQKDHFENPHVGTSEKIHMKRIHFSKEVLQKHFRLFAESSVSRGDTEQTLTRGQKATSRKEILNPSSRKRNLKTILNFREEKDKYELFLEIETLDDA